ncbi:hypothetical protein [Nocardia sp. NPDC051570]|uniref:hypothetical protein n=1 Tax=Nocardia sp. NPDC051570 TaxID=3364324 RepID=UPI0037A9BB90
MAVMDGPAEHFGVYSDVTRVAGVPRNHRSEAMDMSGLYDLTVAEARALRALNCGGMLTERQIKNSANLDQWTARRTVANLASRGLIVTGARPGRFEITILGRNTLAAKSSDYGRSAGR